MKYLATLCLIISFFSIATEDKIKADIDSGTLAELMANAALEKKAEDIKILDLAGITDIADHFVIATGNGGLHVKAIADHIRDGVDSASKPWHIEGYDTLKWVLLDYVDVVIHIFEKETRDYYDIERLWADAKTTTISDEK